MHSVRFAEAVGGYLWLIWWLIWWAWAFSSKKTQQRETIASRLSYTAIVWAAVYLLFFARHLGVFLMGDIFPRRTWIAWTGVAITALGFAFTLWARAILGRNWSSNVTVKVGHEFIRTGPYRLVRHPIYTGILIAALGSIITQDEWRGILAFLLLWLAFDIKRRKEEQFMRQTFGSQYDDYTRTTGALFPMPVRRSS